MGIGAAIVTAAVIGAGTTAYSMNEAKKQTKKAEQQAKAIENEQKAEMERRNQRIKEIKTRMFNVANEEEINTEDNKLYGN